MSDRRTASRGRHLTSCSSSAGTDFAIDVLGPLRVRLDGQDVPLPGRRHRALLALFAVNANVVVPAERLADQLWDGEAPPAALVTLRSYISNLRQTLGDGDGAAARIVTTTSGYRLDLPDQGLDLDRFRRSVAQGHEHQRRREPQLALQAFDSALDQWRGEPLAELADHEVVIPLVVELQELRAGAVEGRLRALVEIGRHVEAVSGLESLVTDQPLRESPRELLMMALYRSGRSAEALEVHRRFRAVLQEELGIEPSKRLDQLVGAMLNRDPRLDPVPARPEHGVLDLPPVALPAAELVVSLIETLRAVSEQTAAAAGLLTSQLGEGAVRPEDVGVARGQDSGSIAS